MLNAELYSITGDYRDQNEDAAGVFYNQTDQQLLVMCDGMGGHLAGEVASQYVLESLQTRFERENLIEADQAEAWLKRTLQEVNLELYTLSQENEAYRGMGTTCVCAIVFDNHIIFANIGDSRAYLINSRECNQVTMDHTFVNQLVMLGQITEEEAFQHPKRHIITKVMGTDKHVKPDIYTRRTHFYQYLLMNTDGLTDYVTKSELQEILNEDASLNDLGERLLARAEENEAKDNVTFILAEIAGEPV